MRKNNLYVTFSIFIIILILILNCINLTVHAEELTTIVINEVMYNPEEDDKYNEWIVI